MKTAAQNLMACIDRLPGNRGTLALTAAREGHQELVDALSAPALDVFAQTIRINCKELVKTQRPIWSFVNPAASSVPFADFADWASRLSELTLVLIFNVRDEERKTLFREIFAGVTDIDPRTCPCLRLVLIDRSYSDLVTQTSSRRSTASNLWSICNPGHVVNLDDSLGILPEDGEAIRDVVVAYLGGVQDLETRNIQELVDSLAHAPSPHKLLIAEREDMYQRIFGDWHARLSLSEVQAVLELTDLYADSFLKFQGNKLTVSNPESVLKLVLTPPALRGQPDGWHVSSRLIDDFNKSVVLESAARKLCMTMAPLCSVLKQYHGFAPRFLGAARNSRTVSKEQRATDRDELLRWELATLITAHIFRRNCTAHNQDHACRLLDRSWNTFLYLLFAVAKSLQPLNPDWPLPPAQACASLLSKLAQLISKSADPRLLVARKQLKELSQSPLTAKPGFFKWPLYARALIGEYSA